jgi:malate dehydrogenase (oxaloacetate-decarboxylating)(NADP+)
VRDVIGLAPGAQTFAAMNVLMLGERTLFLTDTFVNEEPSAAQLAEIARMAADEVRRFGRPPRSRSCRTPTSARPSAARRSACAKPPSASAR